MGLTANVYIDGFNVYYCTVRETPYKWLDLRQLCCNLFPRMRVNRLMYFSARVTAVPWDPGAPTRQDFYWRALRTTPNLEIVEGSFVSWARYLPKMPFVYKANGRPEKVRVLKTEEKGSDVNLAAHLVYDNCVPDADESVVISNDSDLADAIEIVTARLRRLVTVVNPNRTMMVRKDRLHCGMNRELVRVATATVLSINEKVLAASQFPDVMADSHGTFRKPAAW